MATNVTFDTQVRTFQNWCNKHLDATHQINNLETDFCDGIKLVALVEALAKKKVHGKVQKSSNQIVCYSNVSLGLDFLRESEKLNLVNIGKQISYYHL